jgi:membrane protease YdiL (CAAX protease family)
MDRPPPNSPTTDGATTFRDVRWELSDVVLALAPVVGMRVLAEVGRPEDWASIPRWVGLIVLVAQVAWFVGLPVWLARHRGVAVFRLPRARSVVVEGMLALPLILLTWFVLAAAVIVWEAVSGEPIRPGNPFEGRYPSRAEFVALLVFAATVAPIGEELLFRGLVYNALRRRMPVAVAVVLQALAFGFLHPYGLAHAALATGIGLVLGLVYEWRKTLLAPIALHMLQNAAAALMAFAVSSTGVTTPFLGINGEPTDGGCRVTQVAPGSGADEAGLRAGDVITAVEGRRVANIQDVAALVRQHRPGERVGVDFIRDGTTWRVDIELRRRE